MAYRIILDFENDMIEFDTPAQQGTEYHKGLSEKKDEILKVLGYEQVDMRNAVQIVNDYVNGEITEEEFLKKMEKECEE